MVEKKAGLTPLQIEVLEWIKAGQPRQTFADDDNLQHRVHARRLEKYGLVSISGSGDTWRVKLTALGRKWPEVPAWDRSRSKTPGGTSKAKDRSGSRTPAKAASSSAEASAGASRKGVGQSGESQGRKIAPRQIEAEGTLELYHVQVTRVQVADRWVRASSEEEAARQAREEFGKPYDHNKKWTTTATDVEILEVEQIAAPQPSSSPAEGPLLLSLVDAAAALGVPSLAVEELVSKGEIEWTEVGGQTYISQNALRVFVEENSRKGQPHGPGGSSSETCPESGSPNSSQSETVPTVSSALGPTSTVQDRGTEAVGVSTTRKRPPHPGQVLMADFIGSRQKLHEIVEETGVNGKKLYAIAKGEKHMSPEVAASLGVFFGNGQKFWMNLQRRYDVYRE